MRRKYVTILAFVLLIGACGGVAGLIEQAQFALDQCNPTSETTLANCQEAVDRADSVQVGDPTNLDAAMVESSGYLGLARLDFLSFAADLTDLGNNAEGDFAEFRTIVSDYETDTLNTAQGLTGLEIELTDLQAAKDAFGDLLAGVAVGDDGIATDDTAQRASFQLGIIQALDAFIRPVKVAGAGAANVADIDATVSAVVEADFLNGDNNLVIGGTTEEEGGDLLQPLRENFCRCDLNGGFNAACLRDLMRCQLSDDLVPEQDYDGGGAVRADCTTLTSPAGLDACASSDTN